MASKLQTYTQPGQDEHHYDVHWKAFHSHGLIRVHVTAAVEDKHIVAELFAIHHLFINRRILGENRFGTDMVLEVSSGAIRKLCLGISTKKHLVEWTQLLNVRLRDAKIEVSKEKEFIQTPLTQHEDLVCSEPPRETATLFGVGDVILTEHVLEQFKERNNNINFGKAMKQLIKELGDCMTRQIDLPCKVLLQKARKYPNQHHVRYFQNFRTSRQFVVSMPPDTTPILLTAYNRES